MTRYDLGKGTYKPSITVARENDDHYEGVQHGDVVAVHGDRVGISWEGPYPADFGPRTRIFEVVPARELWGMIELAEAVAAEWGAQAAAEIAAETDIPQHLVW